MGFRLNLVFELVSRLSRGGSEGISPSGPTGVLNPGYPGRDTYGKVFPVGPSLPEPFAAHGKFLISPTTIRHPLDLSH